METIKKLSIYAASAMLIFASCKKEAMQPAPSPEASEKGRLQVKMTDGPANYAALNMEITGLEVYHAEKGWIKLSQDVTSVDVLSLKNGVTANLNAATEVDAGLYTKMKVIFSDQSSLGIKSSNGSASATVGLKWNGPQEAVIAIDDRVSPGTNTEILLDFQVSQSITETVGTYFVKPVITEIKDAATGAKGKILGTSSASVMLTNGTKTYDTHISATGEFLFQGLEPGTYDMIIFPLSNLQGPLLSPKKIQGVSVTKGHFNNVGTVML